MILLTALMFTICVVLMAIVVPKMLFDCILVGFLIWLMYQLYKLQEEHDEGVTE